MLATQNRLKSQLNDAIEQAQSVLDNSDGMVADDSVRVALQQAIDSARNLANGTNLKENDVTAAVDALNAAKDAVQQAMDQYQEASSTPNTVTNNTNIGTNGALTVVLRIVRTIRLEVLRRAARLEVRRMPAMLAATHRQAVMPVMRLTAMPLRRILKTSGAALSLMASPTWP